MTASSPVTSPSPVPSAPPGPLPTIVPNRQRLDNRFPVLAFTIRTGGRPLFEVLLTTERALFDPASAARRSSSNFYAGRQDGGLARAAAEDTAFVVPAAALRRFADAKPRPGEIYYTVAAYATADGPPVLAHPVTMLATTAPFVLLGRDFAAQTLAHVLSVPAHKLAPALEAEPVPDYAPAVGLELDDDDIPVSELQSWSSEADEDDEVAAAAAAWDEDDDEPAAMSLDHDDELAGPPAHAYAADDEGADHASAYGDDDLHDEHGYGLATEDEEDPYAESYAEDDEDESQASDDGFGVAAEDDESQAQAYDDGFGVAADEDDSQAPAYDDGLGAPAEAYAGDDYDEAGWAGAAAAEPATLSDADDELVDRELAGAAAYDDGFGVSYAGADDEPYHGNGSGNGVAALASPPFGTGSGSPRELDIPARIAIVAKIGALFETREGFRGINADSEFSTPNLPQHGRWHVGLTYGFIGFTQDSGLLGRLLARMRLRDPGAFEEIFGPAADELVAMTNAHGPSSRDVPGGRGPRVQPVAGADLWTEPWLSRFRRAADHDEFQAAQNETAVQTFLEPVLPFAAGFGLDTERALAMVVDRAIHMDVDGARAWLIGAIGPIRTDAERQRALDALRIDSLRDLQRAAGLKDDGSFGPITHAALVGALRRLGPASPVPIPTREQLIDAIVARADGEQAWWRARPRTIRASQEFADEPLTWQTPTTGAV